MTKRTEPHKNTLHSFIMLFKYNIVSLDSRAVLVHQYIILLSYLKMHLLAGFYFTGRFNLLTNSIPCGNI